MNRLYLVHAEEIRGSGCAIDRRHSWASRHQPAAQGTVADQLTGKLVITGASTLAPLIAEIGKRFESLYPKVRIDVQSGGSSRGVADARQGLADIGMVSRAMKDDERDLSRVPRRPRRRLPHSPSRNPVQALTDEQVVAIYTGKITNWKDVGGTDAPITVVNKAEGRSTLEVFLHYFKLKNMDVKAQVVIGDNEQGVKTVAGNRQCDRVRLHRAPQNTTPPRGYPLSCSRSEG